MVARCSRRGLTLKDLLAIVAVLGLLLLLLVPALFSSRNGNNRRIQCINNLRQLGLGLQFYLNNKNVFPNAGTYGEYPAALTSGDPGDSVINDAFNGRFGRIRTGTPDFGPLHSWVVYLLPYIDQQTLYNDFNLDRPYFDRGRPGDDPQRPTNWIISTTEIGILTCPDDGTVLNGAGNLSYVCNGGFSLWHAQGHAYGWSGTRTGGTTGPALDWGQSVATQTGVMFLGTHTGRAPWDYQTTPSSISDGASTTLLLTENTLAGASPGNSFSGGMPTNWAGPHPNFVLFIGSDDVCTKGARTVPNCSTAGDLAPSSPQPDGWARANRIGTFENINYGTKLTQEGSSPFPNSNHPGGVVVVMCDGSAKFISEAIAGTVWAKLITPAGGRLPAPYRQTSLPSGALNPAIGR